MPSETRNCQSCKQNFVIEPDDFSFYEKIKVPPPTFCPECRLQRRMAWRNERGFFKDTCKKCGKKIITVYPPDSGITVYCRPCWWSDDWDGLEYGVDYDPSKPFLEQIKQLLYKVPLPDLFGLYTTLENSEYTNMVGYLKNCYFLTMADWNENCAYGSYVFHSKDSYDSLILNKSELCYETVNCRQCYKTIFSDDCENCRNVSFSKNCVSCSDCIGCVNLKNQKFHIFNKPYTKEEYERLAPQYLPTSRTLTKKFTAEAAKLSLTHPTKYIHERLTNNVSGDYIYDAKNVRDSFIVQDMENARFCALVLPGKTNDCYDHTHYGGSTELLYETLQVGNQASNIIGCWFVITGVENINYSMWAIGGSNLFGCVGVKKREHCILNKQYTKKEYESLKSEIITQMNENPYIDTNGRSYKYGEFFPIEMSPFPYNTSSAEEILPLKENEAKDNGYKWRTREKSAYTITVPVNKIPDDTKAIPDTILNEILGCAHKGECEHQCSMAFLLTKNELEFYKRMQLPLPEFCPNCRHHERLQKRNPFKLWKRQCQCSGAESSNGVYKNTGHNHLSHKENDPCPNEFETSYAPDQPKIIYCESCYNAEVV